jgi:glycosyltransferase involved in cell wall biosynthesis
LNILHINASYKPAYIYGGPTVSVAKLCEELVKSGRQKTEDLQQLGLLADFDYSKNEKDCHVIPPRNNKKVLTKSNKQTARIPGEPQHDIAVHVYTTLANGKEELSYLSGSMNIVSGVPVYYFKRLTKDHSHFSPSLLVHLWKTMKRFDIIHIHAWWNFVSVLSALICVWKGKKYILSPRGTLSSYSFVNSKSFLKRIFHQYLGGPLLKKAIFQVSSEKEKRDIERLIGKYSPITVIPNFVELNKAWEIPIFKRNTGKAELLFFSRIEEKKGLEFLLRACTLLDIPYQLTIAGTGDPLYIQHLKKQAEDLKITPHISWLGEIVPAEKFNTLAAYDLVVLPSYDENFANVVIESLACGTAVLLSPDVGLADYVQQEQLGWVCEQNPERVAAQIQYIFTEEKNQLEKIKKVGPMTIKNDYNEEKLRNTYIRYYQSIYS